MNGTLYVTMRNGCTVVKPKGRMCSLLAAEGKALASKPNGKTLETIDDAIVEIQHSGIHVNDAARQQMWWFVPTGHET